MSQPPTITFRSRFGPEVTNPALSVVIVTNRTGAAQEPLAALAKQSCQDFETIVVDNGNESLDSLKWFRLRYLKLDRNHGLSGGRNIAVPETHGPLIAFLDDDAVPDVDWVKATLEAFERLDVVGIRGRGEPKTGRLFNHLARHYDLGDEPIPAALDFEATIAVRAEALRTVGGFDPTLFGYEGWDLTVRLEAVGVVLYVPSMVVRHDYADSWSKYTRKIFRHALIRQRAVLDGTFRARTGPPGRDPAGTPTPGSLTALELAALVRFGNVVDWCGIRMAEFRWRREH